MMPDTKLCRHCRQPIAIGARICQHCHGYQAWFAGARDPRYQMIWPVLIIIAMVGWLYFMQRSFDRDEGGGEPPRLEVQNFTTSVMPSNEGSRLFVVGRVHNTSSRDAASIVFRVNIFDDANHLVDTFLGQTSGLVVPGNGTSSFRVSATLGVPSPEAKRIEVNVERAKPRSRWD